MGIPSDLPPVCDYENSDYQAAFWEEGGRAYEDKVEAIALKRLLPAAGEWLLEIGAGAGRNTPRYEAFRRIVLLDYSLTQLQQAQTRLGIEGETDPFGRYVFVAANVYRLPFRPAVFDTATMIRVIHHLADPALALRQIRQALAGDGTFILEFANKQNLKAILRFIFGRQKWNPFDQSPVEFVHLNYDFHPAAIRRWLLESGFTALRMRTVSHFRVDVLKRSLPLPWLVGLDAFLQPSGAFLQLSPSVFVQARPRGGSDARPAIAQPHDLFCCPACGATPLDDRRQEALACPSCGAVWPRRGGIYDFRVG